MVEHDLITIDSVDGDWRIVIVARGDGCFRYREDRYFPPAPEEGERGGWVNQAWGSGLFSTAGAAEREARLVVPWLRRQFIPVDKVGKIVSGDESGWFVKVLDDSESTGGFLILTAAVPECRGGHDSWVKDKDALAAYFEEAGWVVEWAD